MTDTLVIHKTDTVILNQYIEDSATTFILSRHAETTGIGTDPALSVVGQERAIELARVLNVDISQDKTKHDFNIKKVRRTISAYLESQKYSEEYIRPLLNQRKNK